MKRLITVVGLVAASAVALAAAASAVSGTPVAFVVNNRFGGPQATVVSSIPGCAAAAVTDTTLQAAFRGPMSLFSGTKLFDCGASGTFTLSYSVHAYACSPTDSGSWQVADGTGVYAGMSGEGLVSGTYYGPSACNHAGLIDNYTGTFRLASG